MIDGRRHDSTAAGTMAPFAQASISPTDGHRNWSIDPASLGDRSFRIDYGIRYAYVTGAMYKGIASKELVVAMAQRGLMGYLGTGGLDLREVSSAIDYIKTKIRDGQSYGMNLLADATRPTLEEQTVDLYLEKNIRYVEAAAYLQPTRALVRYRVRGARRSPQGKISVPNRIMAKVSRPEVAEQFMRPAPIRIVESLLQAGQITTEEADIARYVSVAQDVCVEADSGGHTDRGVAYVLMPAMLSLRKEVMSQNRYLEPIRIGAAGGIGTPEAAAAALILGADFIVTGSINQCTVEANTSDRVKDMLQTMNVQDTDYAPAGDMFEVGAKVQVLRKGLLFPARANKLYELYMRHNSWGEIDQKIRAQIEQKYFRRSFGEVWAETQEHCRKTAPSLLDDIDKNLKRKMAMVFKWYFVHSTRLALNGDEEQAVDYQVQCGPALGAFNQWVRGSDIENWRQRYVADIAERIMNGAAQLLGDRLAAIARNTA
ncbi:MULTISPECIES: PfaD family polyunsaturated fatty acid/polyketide biosynthesis protein [unclassified Bradyrhizobium]|uniref:PfaD family polyunsaturated fatty acid/polyketide biosynthesis protein n=1 Tax=unclassified Bradyrhizobium TaxID=2631580 RepID=UPI0029160F85|nr:MULTISPECIES: PfaD family polyunsaturated fatty acid/polyketide biosynthesis protein [unclassified Bradyrhizobium]